jgi:predicted dehydrogenase
VSSEDFDSAGEIMRVLVVGGGSIGKRHAGNFKQLGIERVGVVDPRADRRAEVTAKLGLTDTYESVDAALQNGYDAVVVGVPTAFHTEVAHRSLAAGAHVLMEKPISDRLDGLSDLVQETSRLRRVFMVGYTYRFWPPLLHLHKLLSSGIVGRVYFADVTFSEYLPDWHPWEDYRSWFMSKKEQGGGAMLDESHAVDMARWLFGEIRDVFCLTGNLSHLEMTADDHAQFLVNYESGARGTIHMDLFGRRHRRTIDVVAEHGNITWDFFANTVQVQHVDQRYSQTTTFTCERNDMFLAEAAHFLDAIAGRTEPLVSAGDAARTLAVLLAGFTSSQSGNRVRCR